MSEHIVVNPSEWAQPKGYSNGIVATGKTLHIGGQIGWNQSQEFESTDFVDQFEQTLLNTLAVLTEAGGEPSDIVRMTIFVTDMDAYRSNLRALGGVWKRLMGRWYPAMALVGVTALVERDALIEIETTAVLGEE